MPGDMSTANSQKLDYGLDLQVKLRSATRQAFIGFGTALEECGHSNHTEMATAAEAAARSCVPWVAASSGLDGTFDLEFRDIKCTSSKLETSAGGLAFVLSYTGNCLETDAVSLFPTISMVARADVQNGHVKTPMTFGRVGVGVTYDGSAAAQEEPTWYELGGTLPPMPGVGFLLGEQGAGGEQMYVFVPSTDPVSEPVHSCTAM